MSTTNEKNWLQFVQFTCAQHECRLPTKISIESLDKAKNSELTVVSMMIDDASKNTKMMKSMLKKLNERSSIMRAVSMNFESNFTHKCRKCFILNFIPHVTKCVRKNWIKKTVISNVLG